VKPAARIGFWTVSSPGEKKGSAVRDMQEVIDTSRTSGQESYLAASFCCSRRQACRYSGLQKRPRCRVLSLCSATIGGPPSRIAHSGAMKPPQTRSLAASGLSLCSAL
jgi:hypothetical protein